MKVLEWLRINQEVNDKVLVQIINAVQNADAQLSKIDAEITETEASQSLETDKDQKIIKAISELKKKRRRVYIAIREEIDSILK